MFSKRSKTLCMDEATYYGVVNIDTVNTYFFIRHLKNLELAVA